MRLFGILFKKIGIRGALIGGILSGNLLAQTPPVAVYGPDSTSATAQETPATAQETAIPVEEIAPPAVQTPPTAQVIAPPVVEIFPPRHPFQVPHPQKSVPFGKLGPWNYW